MEIKILKKNDPEWEEVRQFVAKNDWGTSLADKMANEFTLDWERVVAIWDEGRIAGFCDLVENDNMPDCDYSPYIGYVYVNPDFRGRRYSEKMLRACEECAASAGFDTVYIVSGHVGLYEKFGYQLKDYAKDYKGRESQVFFKKI